MLFVFSRPVAFLSLTWLIAAIIVGNIGKNRNIGYWPATLISLIFSPIIGLIAVALSRHKDAPVTDTADMLTKYKKLLDEGGITADEYETQKQKLFKK